MSSDPKIENQPPSAWVWSQYRGDVTEPRTSPRKTTTPSNRERPPLIPQQSGIATGPVLVALILLAAGMAWWFSGAQHKPEAVTQENAEPAASDAVEPPAEPVPAEPEAQAPSAEPAAPADAAPQAEPENKPEPAKERPKKKKKKH